MNEYSLCLTVCYPEIRAGNGKAVILTDFFFIIMKVGGVFLLLFFVCLIISFTA